MTRHCKYQVALTGSECDGSQLNTNNNAQASTSVEDAERRIGKSSQIDERNEKRINELRRWSKDERLNPNLRQKLSNLVVKLSGCSTNVKESFSSSDQRRLDGLEYVKKHLKRSVNLVRDNFFACNYDEEIQDRLLEDLNIQEEEFDEEWSAASQELESAQINEKNETLINKLASRTEDDRLNPTLREKFRTLADKLLNYNTTVKSRFQATDDLRLKGLTLLNHRMKHFIHIVRMKFRPRKYDEKTQDELLDKLNKEEEKLDKEWRERYPTAN